MKVDILLTLLSATVVLGVIDNCDDCLPNGKKAPSSNNINSNNVIRDHNSFHQSNSQLQQQQQQQNSIHGQKLNKLQDYLNPRQRELVKRNTGSLLAIARALKMTIVECQNQMRNEPWDCPIYSFSVKPTDIFGKLMSRNFRETSFIYSLLSAAITHSVTRACTEGTIHTCSKSQIREGLQSEDIYFGREFAREFMAAAHELPTISTAQYLTSVNQQQQQPTNNEINNFIGTGNGPTGNDLYDAGAAQHEQSLRNNQLINSYQAAPAAAPATKANKPEKSIRNYINTHNDELGTLLVMEGMRRECKCHGLSGACSVTTCWLRLSSFRDVAKKLHERYASDKVVKVIYYPDKQKSLTSATTINKKSNKKRSSSSTIPVNGLTRSTTTLTASSQQQQTFEAAPAADGAVIGSRRKGAGQKRHAQQQLAPTNLPAPSALVSSSSSSTPDIAVNCENCTLQTSPANSTLSSTLADDGASYISQDPPIKRRPVARSIGITPQTYIIPSPTDMLYYEESPSFCLPDERYSIKGTKGRVCVIDNPDATNDCKELCCGRGYKTEVRIEKYKCECKFQYCCRLECNTCTRRKTIHKCL